MGEWISNFTEKVLLDLREQSGQHKKIRLESGASDKDSSLTEMNIIDDSLLLPGEAEEIKAMLQRQCELDRQCRVLFKGICKSLFDYKSLTEDQRQEGIDTLKLLAVQGYAKSAFFLGILYCTGNAGFIADKDEAIRYFRIGAGLGCAECSFAMGAMLLKEFLDEAKEGEAANFFRIAAALGHAKARFNYAQSLYLGKGVEADPKKAIALFEICSGIDNQPEAHYRLAHELRTGKFINKDLPRAVELFSRAALKGDTGAELNLATMLFYGEGTAVNKAAACALYKRGADKGHSTAQYNYAVMKIMGDGVEVNIQEAIHYLKLAAEKKYPSAQHALALRYASGDGIEMDKKKAFELYKMAADDGQHIKSMYQLAKMYETADGTEEDIVSAFRYYTLALKHKAPVTNKVKSLIKVDMGRGEYEI